MSDTILIVDDEPEIADLIEVYLQNEGFYVLKFYSPLEALTALEHTQPDLAVLDVMMPELSGFALCRRIRESYTFPIIMLTAKEEETDKITGLTLGADDYITKPFRPLELVARVMRILVGNHTCHCVTGVTLNGFDIAAVQGELVCKDTIARSTFLTIPEKGRTKERVPILLFLNIRNSAIYVSSALNACQAFDILFSKALPE